jgi:hypothetical protein
MSPPNSCARSAFSRRVPNPFRVGGATDGPPRSSQVRRSFPSWASHATLTCPPGHDNAPYFVAFVASSCSASESSRHRSYNQQVGSGPYHGPWANGSRPRPRSFPLPPRGAWELRIVASPRSALRYFSLVVARSMRHDRNRAWFISTRKPHGERCVLPMDRDASPQGAIKVRQREFRRWVRLGITLSKTSPLYPRAADIDADSEGSPRWSGNGSCPIRAGARMLYPIKRSD